jgi:transaldolase
MKFFLDSAKMDEITYAIDMWAIDGVTTNPRHVQAAGKPFMKTVQDLAELAKGTELSISVEVNPHFSTHEEMVREAHKLASLSPNFAIKLPATEAGFKALKILSSEGIKVNLTLAFSATQVLQAMRMGAYFVSPFIGWKESNAEAVFDFIQEIVAIRDNYAFKTQILVAAVRNGRQIADAAVIGADIVTAGFAVFQEAFEHPYTTMGLGRFQSFWDKTAYE